MPTFDYICEVCGHEGRGSRPDKPPRFCSKGCMSRGMAGVSRKPAKYIITQEMHEQIKSVYKRDSGKGQVDALAERLNLPRWKVSRYAIQQGWIAKCKKEPNWSGKEVEILERNAHLVPEIIQRKLSNRGFRRSVTGIVLKRKRMRFAKNLEGSSACSVAECLGVDIHNVRNAIKAGKLKAKRRGTNRTPQQGGDSWFIRDSDIKNYIINWLSEIDIRKVDKYWFVDLLTAKL